MPRPPHIWRLPIVSCVALRGGLQRVVQAQHVGGLAGAQLAAQQLLRA